VRRFEDPLGRNEEELRARVDEAPDEPRARDTVDLGPGSGDPDHPLLLSDLDTGNIALATL
jgi:hypothetical protein